MLRFDKKLLGNQWASGDLTNMKNFSENGRYNDWTEINDKVVKGKLLKKKAWRTEAQDHFKINKCTQKAQQHGFLIYFYIFPRSTFTLDSNNDGQGQCLVILVTHFPQGKLFCCCEV